MNVSLFRATSVEGYLSLVGFGCEVAVAIAPESQVCEFESLEKVRCFGAMSCREHEENLFYFCGDASS